MESKGSHGRSLILDELNFFQRKSNDKRRSKIDTERLIKKISSPILGFQVLCCTNMFL